MGNFYSAHILIYGVLFVPLLERREKRLFRIPMFYSRGRDENHFVLLM